MHPGSAGSVRPFAAGGERLFWRSLASGLRHRRCLTPIGVISRLAGRVYVAGILHCSPSALAYVAFPRLTMLARCIAADAVIAYS